MGHNPQWGMYIVWYFFLGGIASGAYFIAALADLLGEESDKPLVRTGYWVAFPLTLILPVFLILDLGMPSRSFNMFAAFKMESPMSAGSWGLLGFGAFALASWLLVLYENKITGAADIRRKISIPGAALGFFIASYTGVLLSTTNRPLWGGNNLIGALFLASAASTGVGAIALVLQARGGLPKNLWKRLTAMDEVVMILELLVFAGFLGMIGDSASSLVYGPFAGVFWAFLILGLAIPFLLQFGMTFFQSRLPATSGTIMVSVGLLLAGGFILRYLIIVVGQA